MKNLQIEEIYGLYTQTAGVCTDTRNILQGGMFFALKGETFNGNAFAVAALEGGAAYAVVDEPQVEEAAPERIILVEDVLVALQQMARHHRKQFRIPVVALTGTNGKTTTSTLVYQYLRYIQEDALLISSNGIFLDDLRFETFNTTPSIYTIYEFLLFICFK